MTDRIHPDSIWGRRIRQVLDEDRRAEAARIVREQRQRDLVHGSESDPILREDPK